MGIVFNAFSHNGLRIAIVRTVVPHCYWDLKRNWPPQATKSVRHPEPLDAFYDEPAGMASGGGHRGVGSDSWATPICRHSRRWTRAAEGPYRPGFARRRRPQPHSNQRNGLVHSCMSPIPMPCMSPIPMPIPMSPIPILYVPDPP
jgi:hypothetical protein